MLLPYNFTDPPVASVKEQYWDINSHACTTEYIIILREKDMFKNLEHTEDKYHKVTWKNFFSRTQDQILCEGNCPIKIDGDAIRKESCIIIFTHNPILYSSLHLAKRGKN